MKQFIALAVCIVFISSAFAQGTVAGGHHGGNAHHGRGADSKKPAIKGTVRNASGDPLADVEIMVYKLDTIVASGYTDEKGQYTTSAVPPGTYVLKIIYPNSDKIITVPGVKMEKNKVLPAIDFKTDPPLTADSSMSFAELTKKKLDKKKPGKK
jgi:Carboxypeptidase regulatory-like domain